jgi:hypothetical protein
MRLNQMKVLSLCDYSGKWAKPYADAGHTVFLVDPKHRPADGEKVWTFEDGMMRCCDTARGFLNLIRQGFVKPDFDVILIAVPCTDFASSGARWFKAKDADGRTEKSAEIVRDCLEIVNLCNPKVWALENPVGRIASVVPELGKWGLIFNPCDYAGFADDPDSEAYTKKTCIWGRFNADLEQAKVEPVFVTASNGDRYAPIMMATGGKSERTKELRSNTPTGFARAFFIANS